MILRQYKNLGIIIALVILAVASRESAAQACSPNCFLIGDRVWDDVYEDGVFDPSSELGLPGVIVRLYHSDSKGQILSSTPAYSATTDSYGHYLIEAPGFAWYALEFVPPAATGTSSYSGITLQDQEESDLFDSDPDPLSHFTHQFYLDYDQDHSSRWDAGIASSPCVTIGDTVWRDVAIDGEYDPTEDAVLPGVTVELWKKHLFGIGALAHAAYSPYKTDVTDLAGKYEFSCISKYEYYVLVLKNAKYPASPYYEPKVSSYVDNDNHCTTKNLPFTLPVDATCASQEFKLGGGHPDTDTTIDLAVACDVGPIDAILLLDTSGSMRSYFGQVIDAAEVVAAKLLSDPMNRVGLAIYGGGGDPADDATEIVSLTNNLDTIVGALNNPSLVAVGKVGTLTNISKGIDVAGGMLVDPSRDRFIVLLSDGKANRPVNDPNGDASELAVASANSAKAGGSKIVTLALGQASGAQLALLASGPEYDFQTNDVRLLKNRFSELLTAMCSGVGTSMPCTGTDHQEEDLATGKFVSGGTDIKWEQRVTGSPTFTPAAVKDPKLGVWKLLPGSKWVSYQSDAGGGAAPAGVRYEYRRSISIPPGANVNAVDLDFRVYGDDEVTSIKIGERELKGAFGGKYDGDAIHVQRRDPGLFKGSSMDLVIEVHDKWGGFTGLDVAGSLRLCLSSGVSTDWHPGDEPGARCMPETWLPQHGKRVCVGGDCRAERPLKIENADETQTAFCIRWSQACCQQATEIPIGSSEGCRTVSEISVTDCCAPEEAEATAEVIAGATPDPLRTPCVGCSLGRQYRYPSPPNPFDLGPKMIAAAVDDAYTGVQHWYDRPPASFILYADQMGWFRTTERWAHADYSSAGEPDTMERYVSTCRRGGAQGCIGWIRGDGMTHGEGYQWTEVDSYTVEPRDCLE